MCMLTWPSLWSVCVYVDCPSLQIELCVYDLSTTGNIFTLIGSISILKPTIKILSAIF